MAELGWRVDMVIIGSDFINTTFSRKCRVVEVGVLLIGVLYLAV